MNGQTALMHCDLIETTVSTLIEQDLKRTPPERLYLDSEPIIALDGSGCMGDQPCACILYPEYDVEVFLPWSRSVQHRTSAKDFISYILEALADLRELVVQRT